ncbi:hypothetical protein Bca4012_001441 [Brassica carinata]
MYEEFTSISGYVCNELFSIGEDGFRTRRMSSFANYLEDVKNLKESFTRSDIIYVPRTQNTKAHRIARSVRKQPSFVVHIDTDQPVWFTESV